MKIKSYPFDPTPETEIRARLHHLKHLMSAHHVDALFLTHKPDIFYFSGTAQDCYLYVPVDNDPVLFVKRYLPRAKKETCIQNILPIDSITRIPHELRSLFPKMPESCALAFDVVPVKDYLFFQKIFHPLFFTDGSAVIAQCRQIKSDWEIRQMENAARVSKLTFDYMQKTLRPGLTEMEFCGMFESFSRTLGHSGKLLTRHYRMEGYPFHLMSGKNGGIPGALDSPVCGTGTANAYPYGAGPKPIETGEPILIDFGTLLNGYHCDESRMFVIGKMPQKALEASKAAIDILHRVADKMRPGIPMGAVYDTALETASKLDDGISGGFLGLPDLKSKFIGHGVGLELTEHPVLAKGVKNELASGMVFAVEPKFIFKDKFAAGIESMIAVTDTGSRFLSLTENKIFYC